jgi:MFS family permease
MPSIGENVSGTPEEQQAGPSSLTTLAPGATPAQSVPDTIRSVPARDRSGELAQQARKVIAGHHHDLARVKTLPWPLLTILSVQAALSARLVWSNTAFQDEALYLWAGRLEWAHWGHSAPIPAFAPWFSGSPVIYPPIGALADSIGGLAAARALSLIFMLIATSLLWGTTSRLFGKRAALFATALFATLANTQFVGAFATYDAMALMLIALATWLAVCSITHGGRPQLALLIAAAGAMALADATKYAVMLFDPVVLAVMSLAAWRLRGLRATLNAGLVMSGAALALLAGGLVLGGQAYWHGIATTTIDRPAATYSTAVILERSYVWTSLVIVLAVVGIVLARQEGRIGLALIAALSMTALLVPAEQVRVHTTVSLQKHVDYGAWFAVMAAGYALARVSQVNRGIGWAPVLFLPIVAFTISSSFGQATGLFQGWPNAAPLMRALRPVLEHDHGRVLAEGDEYSVIPYYLGRDVSFRRIRTTYQFVYADPRSHQRVGMPASFADAIKAGYFGVVVLDYAGGHPTVDRVITQAVDASKNCRESLNSTYFQLHVRRSFTVWTCTPSSGHLGGRRHVAG